MSQRTSFQVIGDDFRCLQGSCILFETITLTERSSAMVHFKDQQDHWLAEGVQPHFRNTPLPSKLEFPCPSNIHSMIVTRWPILLFNLKCFPVSATTLVLPSDLDKTNMSWNRHKSQKEDLFKVFNKEAYTFLVSF